jgi:hypothetical protein
MSVPCSLHRDRGQLILNHGEMGPIQRSGTRCGGIRTVCVAVGRGNYAWPIYLLSNGQSLYISEGRDAILKISSVRVPWQGRRIRTNASESKRR